MKLIKSFRYAFQGLVVAVREQRNLRVHLVVTLAVVAAGFYFQITAIEWTSLLFVIGLVISLELMNTSIESLTDLVTTERKPIAGKVKDIAAAAVMVASLVATIIGIVIFSKYFF